MASQFVRENGLPPTWSLIAAATAAATAAAALAYLGLIIYRIWLHPLARFPGSRLAAVTHWYEAYYELIHRGGAQYASKIREMHNRYGPIIRINPDEISVRDAAFHDKLYAPQPAVRDRHPNFSATLGATKGSFSTVEHQLHRNRRMAYSPFFSSSNVIAAESLMKGMVSHLCERLWSTRDDSSNVRILFAAISFDTFYTMAFGSSLGLLDDLRLADQCN